MQSYYRVCLNGFHIHLSNLFFVCDWNLKNETVLEQYHHDDKSRYKNQEKLCKRRQLS